MPSPGRRVRARFATTHPHVLAAGLAILAGVVVFVIAREVFPYHSLNHDEGVYLQQAAMLLDGALFLQPPVSEAFRPWFFVESARGLYPKYAPVPAGMFALGLAVGLPRLVLALVGAGLVALVYLVTAEVFGHHPDGRLTLADRRTALLAAGLALASPLFLVQTSVFLPYAPTAFWNLLFAFAYLRADRMHGDPDAAGRSTAWAALAGIAIGIAFFARPYTAVLFAAPFLVHALWSLRRDGPLGDMGALRRLLPTAIFGLLGAAVALWYNLLVTGSALVFPYQAFAPLDGIGFGYREILGYSREYTIGLAIRANAEVVSVLLTRWTVAGPLGTLLAVAGILVVVGRRRSVDPRELVLAGIVVSVVAGNVAFWGNLNILGRLAILGDGLISHLGPYYHYDLLLPLSAFGAVGLERAGSWTYDRAVPGRSTRGGRHVAVVSLLVVASVGGAVTVGAATGPLAENAEITEQYESAYAPVETTDFDRALVFVPAPYGDWLNHPFQAWRNDPDFDGNVVYALRERQFAVVDAFPDRTLYRYTYRGQWAPFLGRSVDPHLQRVRHVRGESVTLNATVGIPSGTEYVSVRLDGAGESALFEVAGSADQATFSLSMADGRATLSGPGVTPTTNRSVPLPDSGTVTLEVNVDYGAGQSFAYWIRVPVARDNGDVRALSPYREVCTIPRDCGGEAAYVPGSHRPDVFVRTAFAATEDATIETTDEAADKATEEAVDDASDD